MEIGNATKNGNAQKNNTFQIEAPAPHFAMTSVRRRILGNRLRTHS